MTQTTLGPVQAQERIQTIDIIRGIALFGILVINFTVDDSVGPQVGFTGFSDQFFYWPIRFFLRPGRCPHHRCSEDLLLAP